jgi:hypothetical protein
LPLLAGGERAAAEAGWLADLQARDGIDHDEPTAGSEAEEPGQGGESVGGHAGLGGQECFDIGDAGGGPAASSRLFC